MRNLSLRNKFAVWTTAVVIASTLALVAVVYFVSSRAFRAQADQEMQGVANKTAEELDLWLSSRERDAVNISELEPLIVACTEHKLPDAEQALLRIQRRSPFYENVFLADTTGKLFLDSIGGKSIGVDLTAVAGFRPNAEHSGQGEVWLGEVMKSPVTGRPVALLTAPIRSGDRVVGILGTPIELSEFSDKFVRNYRIRETGYLFLIDAFGTVVAHPDAAKIMSLNIRDTDFGREMLDRDEGSMIYEFDGVSKVLHFRRAQTKAWTVAATVPEKELLAGARTVQLYVLLCGAVMLAGIVLAVTIIAGKVSRSIGSAVSEIGSAVDQYLSASSQIATSSQALAQGTSEQAASIEETSASTEELTSMTRKNAENSNSAAAFMIETSSIVEQANRTLDQMVASMSDINASSDKIAKIIRVIDEIAFQTNILALNAAVEAARAGEAGMGFAVVADEVRNLAQRSAQAARDTTALIEESIAKSGEGRTKLDQVAAAIRAITESAQKVKTLVDEVKLGSEEQARGIEQIAKAMTQMEHVVQNNSASAEESASAAQELNAQSRTVQQNVGRLTALVAGSRDESLA